MDNTGHHPTMSLAPGASRCRVSSGGSPLGAPAGERCWPQALLADLPVTLHLPHCSSRTVLQGLAALS